MSEDRVPSDDELLQRYQEELDGTASRRRAGRNVEDRARERELWWAEEAKRNPSAVLPGDLQYLVR